MSRPRLANAPWQVHATAKILREPTGDPAPIVREEPPLGGDRSVAGDDLYELARRAGLQYGPAFRKLARAALVRPDRIDVDLVDEPGDPAFSVDPARLDACFHGLALVFGTAADHGGAAYVPVRFGELMLRRPGRAFTKARIDILRRDERIIIADLTLVDARDDVVLCIRAARFQALRGAEAGEAHRPLVRQRLVLACEPTAAHADRPLTLAALRGRIGATAATALGEDFVLLEGWATSLALRIARALATGGLLDVEAIVAAGRVPPSMRRWLERILVSLARSGLLTEDGETYRLDPAATLPDPDDILRAIGLELQHLSAELLVAASATTAVRALLEGGSEGMSRPLPAKVLDAYELGSSHARAAAAELVVLLRRSLPNWPRDRALRILQVGFGPLSRPIVALAAETQARVTILDIDRRRLERARLAFAERGDTIFCDDLEGLPEAGFDLVLAASALHRYRRAPSFWSRLRRAMAPGASFLAIEPTPSLFRDLALGLDACLEDGVGDGLCASADEWQTAIQAAMRAEAKVAPIATGGGSALLLSAQVEAERRPGAGVGHALIVGESETEAMSAFATLLASSGQHVSLLVDTAVGPLAEAPDLVVLFANTSSSALDSPAGLARHCLVLKDLAEKLGGRQTILWLVTSGAIATHSNRGADVAAGLWAFSRTLANEVPSLVVRRVDVAADVRPAALAERLRGLVLSGTDETEIVVTASATRVVRFETAALSTLAIGTPAAAARLVRGSGVGADRLGWQAIERPLPATHEVEIEVEAIGLNFRDVMFGLGLLPEEVLENGFAGPTLGLECAGRIARVGASVRHLKAGDRVMAFAKHAFSTHVVTDASVVASIADGLSCAAAATIPVAFLTAYYGLVTCARLKPREWVLIHGGAGGVGLAAIQIARWRGARVIATAGSPERRALLEAFGAEHVFDSRSGAFVEHVRCVTGEGVAVVLNSLSGEAMERSIGVLRPFGRFVELGKRDYVANTHVGLRPFRRNLSYYGVDLDQLLLAEPATARRLMRAVTRLFAEGDLAPLPYRTFEAAETGEAFRLMQASGHVGKLVITPPDPAAIRAVAPGDFRVDAEGVHLVTGGFGGFGLATARWLAARGARHLMLLGRRGPATPEAEEALASLARDGVSVHRECCDVADRAAMKRLFARFGKSVPRLAGVVHAAMVLEDGLIATMTGEALQRVLRPKIAGADVLDQLTRTLQLDYFVLYSSATTLVGNPGQAAYVAANGYLEGLARRRRRAGLPALAVAWGAIEDVGVLARSGALRESLAARAGIKTMTAAAALEHLGALLALRPDDLEDAVVAIAPVAWAATKRQRPTARRSIWPRSSPASRRRRRARSSPT